jgi:hypothetical protein
MYKICPTSSKTASANDLEIYCDVKKVVLDDFVLKLR